MSNEPTSERIAEIRKAHDTGHDERFANLIVGDLLEWVDSLTRQLAAMTAGRDACEVQLHEAFDAGSREIDLLGERLRGRIADLESTIARVEEAAHEARRGAIRLRDERDNARAAIARVEALRDWYRERFKSDGDDIDPMIPYSKLDAALAVNEES